MRRSTYIKHIVVATTQFARLVSHVVDTDHDGTFRSVRMTVGDDGKGFVEVRLAGRRQLRDLFETFRFQLLTDGEQNFLERQILPRVVMVRVRDVQQRCR